MNSGSVSPNSNIRGPPVAEKSSSDKKEKGVEPRIGGWSRVKTMQKGDQQELRSPKIS